MVTGTAGRVSGTYNIKAGETWAGKPYYIHNDNGLIIYAVRNCLQST